MPPTVNPTVNPAAYRTGYPAELRVAARRLLRRVPPAPVSEPVPASSPSPGPGSGSGHRSGEPARRRFLTTTGAAALLAFATGLPGSAHAAGRDPARIRSDPFTLGVASGDPLPGSVLLWTRLAPRPYEPGGGLDPGRYPVRWELAHDPRFTRIVRRGTVTAHPELDHSVRVEITGLDPARVYHYRFRAGPWLGPAGRTRTAPAPGARVRELRLAAVSCQAYHDGYFTAHGRLATEDLHAVIHLGDYLYEYPVPATGGARGYPEGTLPPWFDRETVTLEEYRLRYGLYRSDPDLRAAHAAHPWVLTWDDHETDDNYAAGLPGDDRAPEDFLLRRAAAYRAYWENQPLRPAQRPRGAELRLYRRLRFGRLAQIDVLDTRQYRSDQVPGGGWQQPGAALHAPGRTMLGTAQERWLADGWRRSEARWNLLAQQVVLARRRDAPGPGHRLSTDAWDGYPAARDRLLAGAGAAGIRDLVVLSADVHVGYGFDLVREWDEPRSPVVGAEIVTTSVSSGRDGTARPANWADLTLANPRLRFYDGRRGYTALTVREDSVRADFRVLSAVTVPGAPVTTAGSFVTVAGDPGLRPG